ncbi:MAG: tetratricopeptide repeat protein [Thiomicrorhabdus sp.]|nr:tetratricopeptide repeat protein [Thiomicrorhabdus sp.]
MPDAMIINVTLNNIQEMVIQNSKQRPVLIHFWSPTNNDSQQANAILEQLAQEMAGEFILAKINVDQQHDIAEKFSNPSAPFYKLIKDADIVTEAGGLQSEEAYRALLKEHIVDEPSEVLRKQAAQAFSQGDVDQALQCLRDAAKENPNNIKIHLDLVQLYLHTDQMEEAKSLFSELPESAQKEPHGRYIQGVLYFTEQMKQSPEITQIQDSLAKNPKDSEALFYLSTYLILNGQVEPAFQTLLQLFSIDRAYQNGRPQKSILQAFDMFSASQPELVTKYRRTFQSLLN